MKADERRVDNHMEQVRAVHRRSAYERTLGRIRFIEQARAEADAGLRPVLRPYLLEELSHLCSLRDAIRAEMVSAGQIAPDTGR